MHSLQLNINLDFQQLLEVVKQLTPNEKTKLTEFLQTEDTLEIPVEAQKLVLARIKKNRENPDNMLDWDVAMKMID